MMQEEPIDIEKNTLPPEGPPETKPRDEKSPAPPRTLRWFALGSLVLFFLVAVILAIVLPLTLDNDSSDDASSDDVQEVFSSEATATEKPVESLAGEANNINYKDKSAFEADLTRVLQDHVRFFIQENRAPFQCWYPYGFYSNSTMSATEDGEVDMTGQDGGEDTDGITDYETNVQEENVDEADVMKADANYVYAAYGNHIVVWDRDGNQVTDVTLTGEDSETKQQIRALLITDQYLVVIVDGDSYYDDYHYHEETEPPEHIIHSYLSTHIRMYLRNDNGSLSFVANKDVHGNYVNARSIGDSVYLQTQSCLNVADYLIDYLPDPELSENFDEYASNVMTRSDFYLIHNFVQKLESELKMVNGDLPTMLQLGPWPKNNDKMDYLSSLTQVTSFNVNDPWSENNELQVSASALMGRSTFPYLYATPDKLVLASNRGSHQPWYQGNLTHVVALEMDSHISRFLSIGTIEGDLLNQYALDIVGNELRSATTVDRDWVDWRDEESRTVNYMTVTNLMSDVEGQMSEKGRIRIGKPNERIMSVRFFDNIAYAVTFEQTDPFYVVDMDVPEVLGELSLPGFSSYLHSMNADNSLLVAVGEDANRRLVVTVFDATDPASPKPVAQNQFGWATNSDARWDYKAFRFLRGAGKVIIPLEIYSRGVSDDGFDGFVVLNVSTDEVEEAYRVSHTHKKGTCTICYIFSGQRSFVYAGDLMTVKNGIVMSTDLDDGDEIWKLSLSLKGENDYCCW